MKKPWLAFLLNFLVAGAGFVYLGKWTWAILNFVCVFGVGMFFAHFAPDQMGVVAAAVGALDGGIAKAVADKMNANLAFQSPPKPADH